MGGTKATGKTIGEVEKLTGIPKRKLKYYIERDIMRPSQRTANGYWFYSEEDIQIAQIITLCQRLGYSDKRIRAFLASSSPQWQEELKQQIARLLEKKEYVEDQLFLAEFLLYTSKFDLAGLTFSNSGNVILDGQLLTWKAGEKDAFCRFLVQLFSVSTRGNPIQDLSQLTGLHPSDPAVQAQIHRLCDEVQQHNSLSPVQLLYILRLAQTLSGAESIWDALLGKPGVIRLITAAMETYCNMKNEGV